MTKLGKVTEQTKSQGQKILTPVEFTGSTMKLRN
jgi:hypothetical protein